MCFSKRSSFQFDLEASLSIVEVPSRGFEERLKGVLRLLFHDLGQQRQVHTKCEGNRVLDVEEDSPAERAGTRVKMYFPQFGSVKRCGRS